MLQDQDKVLESDVQKLATADTNNLLPMYHI